MRVAVTGAAGRLGSALVSSLRAWATGDRPIEVLPWTRAAFDLDEPGPVVDLVAIERPDVVIHAAAWTDVDGCARDPGLALRRNGDATRVLAEACAAAGASMILVSTNEVFDGEPTARRGYRTDDAVNPPNAYGRSKLAGETGAAAVFGASDRGGGTLAIVRTAWLFGSGKPDFPAKIASAARQAVSEGRMLRVVNDEFGTPTYVRDLADATVRLALAGGGGIHHVVNEGTASRAEWARDVLARFDIDAPIEEISLAEHDRPSRPPRWGVLEATPLPGGQLRHWRDAMADRIAPVQAPR